MIKDENRDYFLVHFLYCKGVSYGSFSNYRISFNDYFVKYAEQVPFYRDFLKWNDVFGGCAVQGEMNPDTNERYSYIFDKIHKFKYKSMNYNWLVQIYNIRWTIVKGFLDDCGYFLDKPCRMLYDSDKNQSHEIANFFEYVFPQIVDRSGYIRYTEDLWPQRYNVRGGRLDFNAELKRWQLENGLELLRDFKFKNIV